MMQTNKLIMPIFAEIIKNYVNQFKTGNLSASDDLSTNKVGTSSLCHKIS